MADAASTWLQPVGANQVLRAGGGTHDQLYWHFDPLQRIYLIQRNDARVFDRPVTDSVNVRIKVEVWAATIARSVLKATAQPQKKTARRPSS